MACGVPAMYLFHHFGSLLRWAPHTLFTHGSSLFPKPLGWNLADLSGKPELEPESVPEPGPTVDKQASAAWLVNKDVGSEEMKRQWCIWETSTYRLFLSRANSFPSSVGTHLWVTSEPLFGTAEDSSASVHSILLLCFFFFLLPSVQHVVWSKEFHLLAATRVTCSLNDLLWGKEKLSELCNTVQWCMRNLCQIQEGKENKNTAVLWNVSQD